MLSNVGRHARASALAVDISCDDGELRVAVRDNGVGAALATFEAANAYGVMGMRERAWACASVPAIGADALACTVPPGLALR